MYTKPQKFQFSGSLDELVVSYKFSVFLMTAQSVDLSFQKVSGLSTKIDTEVFYEGGDNVSAYHLPNRVQYGNLFLEKGKVAAPINTLEQVDEMFSSFTFNPIDIMVCSVDHDNLPLSSWVLESAYPVNWSISDLDANANTVLIDKLELAYSRLVSVK